MTRELHAEIRRLEGRLVRLALADGSQIERCELVSAGHRRAGTLWVLLDGTDTFVPLTAVTHCSAVA